MTTVTERQQGGRQFRTVERPRRLLDESEVLRLSKADVIVFLPDGNPVICETFGPGEHNAFLQEALPVRPKHEVGDHMFALCKATVDHAETSGRRPLRFYIARFLAKGRTASEFVWRRQKRSSRFEDVREETSRFQEEQ